MITYIVLKNFRSFASNLLDSFKESFDVVFSSIDITDGKTVNSDDNIIEEFDLEIKKDMVRERC